MKKRSFLSEFRRGRLAGAKTYYVNRCRRLMGKWLKRRFPNSSFKIGNESCSYIRLRNRKIITTSINSADRLRGGISGNMSFRKIYAIWKCNQEDKITAAKFAEEAKTFHSLFLRILPSTSDNGIVFEYQDSWGRVHRHSFYKARETCFGYNNAFKGETLCRAILCCLYPEVQDWDYNRKYRWLDGLKLDIRSETLKLSLEHQSDYHKLGAIPGVQTLEESKQVVKYDQSKLETISNMPGEALIYVWLDDLNPALYLQLIIAELQRVGRHDFNKAVTPYDVKTKFADMLKKFFASFHKQLAVVVTNRKLVITSHDKIEIILPSDRISFICPVCGEIATLTRAKTLVQFPDLGGCKNCVGQSISKSQFIQRCTELEEKNVPKWAMERFKARNSFHEIRCCFCDTPHSFSSKAQTKQILNYFTPSKGFFCGYCWNTGIVVNSSRENRPRYISLFSTALNIANNLNMLFPRDITTLIKLPVEGENDSKISLRCRECDNVMEKYIYNWRQAVNRVDIEKVSYYCDKCKFTSPATLHR